ncbi:uncharacterized protein LOC136093417 [Hydra vulgaris]|uniref:uncharacterized protein LOC136093417 n=1 Tax=Hydra vulgaris TaxID=6087 RepID=UPI0032EA1F32
MFIKSREKLKEKFEKLSQEKLQHKEKLLHKQNNNNNNNNNHEKPIKKVKEVTLNLANSDIPMHHKKLFDLGLKFVPNPKHIPYLDIITITESSALKLQYNKKKTKGVKLKQDVLRILKMAKPIKSNLDKEQRKALYEIKKDDNIMIYPFDKGSGLVRINSDSVLTKI